MSSSRFEERGRRKRDAEEGERWGQRHGLIGQVDVSTLRLSRTLRGRAAEIADKRAGELSAIADLMSEPPVGNIFA